MVDPDAVPGRHPGGPPPPLRSEVVDWITDATTVGRTITSAIAPVFASYATVVIPADGPAKTAADAAMVDVLRTGTAAQPWWLGYLDTGVADLVTPDAPRVGLYVGWPYVLLEGGPEQALSLRSNSGSTPWHSALPELIFPRDRSWLVSTLWDDDWRCVGGPADLLDALRRTVPGSRAVSLDEEVTPPGHQLR